MTKNRFLGTAVAVGVALAGVAVTAGPAVAAPAPTSAAVAAGGMSFYDDFWTLEECLQVGRDGLNRGKWWTFDCQESWIDWDLYVAY